MNNEEAPKTGPDFAPVLDGWDSWGRVYQSIKDFTPLARRIFAAHGLSWTPLAPLTPGTNAVFRSGDYVVKIMAPAETGLTPDDTELLGLRHAAAAGVPAPELICHGVLRDRYAFPYLVTTFIEGREAGDVLPGLSDGEKRRFALRLKAFMERFHALPPPPGLPGDLRGQFLQNDRWEGFPDSLRKDILRYIDALTSENIVAVHGDLTGENVLLDDRDGLRLIDFGDCHLAPADYEWPPLVFELFRRDPVLLGTYFAGIPAAEFYDRLTGAVALHDFGGYFVRDACRDTGTQPSAVENLVDLQVLLARRLQWNT